MNSGVLFDVGNLWRPPDVLDDGVGGTASIALEMTVVNLADTDGTLSEKRVLFVSGLEEVEMTIESASVEVILQHDDVRTVEDVVRVLSLEGMERGERKRDLRLWMSWGVDSGVAMTEVRHKEDVVVAVDEAMVRNQATGRLRDRAGI